MEKIRNFDANWEGLQEYSQLIENLLNEIVHNKDLTISQMREKASLCMIAVKEYTDMTNGNIRLLHDQTREMLKKVQFALEESQKNNPLLDEETDYEIN